MSGRACACWSLLLAGAGHSWFGFPLLAYLLLAGWMTREALDG